MNLQNNIDIKLSIRRQITNSLNCNKGFEFSRDTLKTLKEIGDIKVGLNPPWSDNINCHAYALNLYHSREYLDVVKNIGYFANSIFIKYLIQNNYLQEIPNPKKDCLVIYFGDNEDPKHAAIVESEIEDEDDIIVRSKWGTFNALITHKLWHVPCKTENCTKQDYGTSIKYYDFLSQEQAEEYFLKHIQRSQS